MSSKNVVHFLNFKKYISAEYLGTTTVQTATAALNVDDLSTPDQGENGNFPYVYFY